MLTSDNRQVKILNGKTTNRKVNNNTKRYKKLIIGFLMFVGAGVFMLDGFLICKYLGVDKNCQIDAYGCVAPGTIIEDDQTELLNKQNKLTYLHGTLGLKFSYPQEWGSVTIREELGRTQDDKMIKVGLTLAFDGLSGLSRPAVFMHSSNPNTPLVQRPENYWGTEGLNISSLYDIWTWCEGKENCETDTNGNGVSYARQKNENNFDTYYIYNSSSGYSGVVLSPERMVDKYKIESLNVAFKELVDSLEFVK